MNGLDPDQDGREIIARLGVEFDIIDVDSAQDKDLSGGSSHGASLPKSTAYRRDRPQAPRTEPTLGLAELTEFTVLQTLNPLWRGRWMANTNGLVPFDVFHGDLHQPAEVDVVAAVKRSVPARLEPPRGKRWLARASGRLPGPAAPTRPASGSKCCA